MKKMTHVELAEYLNVNPDILKKAIRDGKTKVTSYSCGEGIINLGEEAVEAIVTDKRWRKRIKK